MSCAFYNRRMSLRIVKMPGGVRLSELPGCRKSRRKSILYNRQTRAHPMIFLFFRLFCGATPVWTPFGSAAALPFKRNAAAFFLPAGKKIVRAALSGTDSRASAIALRAIRLRGQPICFLPACRPGRPAQIRQACRAIAAGAIRAAGAAMFSLPCLPAAGRRQVRAYAAP